MSDDSKWLVGFLLMITVFIMTFIGAISYDGYQKREFVRDCFVQQKTTTQDLRCSMIY